MTVYALCRTDYQQHNSGIHPIPYDVLRLYTDEDKAIRELRDMACEDWLTQVNPYRWIADCNEACENYQVLFIREYVLN